MRSRSVRWCAPGYGIASCVLFAALLLGLTAQPGGAQAPGMHRATLTVQWSAEKTIKGTGAFPGSETTRESLDQKIAFDIHKLALPGGPMAGGPGGYFQYQHFQQTVRLISATGKSSYSSQGRVEGGCGTAAVRKSAWTEEGGTNWDSAETSAMMFALAFRGEDLETLMVSSKPFAVTKKTTDLCPNPAPPVSETKEHTVAANAMLPTAAAKPEPDWVVEVSRTASGGWTGTARYRRQESEDTGTGRREEQESKTLTFTFEIAGLAAAAPRPAGRMPAAPAAPAMAEFKQGQITFTQGGKEATWALSKADFGEMSGILAVTLHYTPDGKPAPSGGAALTLDFAKVGTAALLETFSVKNGPGGDARYNRRQGGCTLSVSQASASGVEGSATCTGGFQGAAVTKLAFTAKP